MTPTEEYRRSGHHAPERLLKGLDAIVHQAIGLYRRRRARLEALKKQAAAVAKESEGLRDLSDHALSERLGACREIFRRGGEKSERWTVPALAAIREAAARQVGLYPFFEQLIGALALQEGSLAEMATGEGKTLTAGLVAVLAGWTKRPCHIITVNDYLVQRDAEWLKPLYQFCGVRVGYVTGAMSPPERQRGYACDVTYATSKEVLADFLRDRLQLGALANPARRLIRRLAGGNSVATAGHLVMRGLHTAIVDEADSVLIDEAVTPLIISMPRKNENLQAMVRTAHHLAGRLDRDQDYRLNLRYREIELTDQGMQRIEQECEHLPGLWRGRDRQREWVRQALVAREFFLFGKQYILADGKVVIVDEFTGRPMPQRSWRQGLHQAIEAKEGLAITDPAETIARLSFQRFFRLYHRLCGMTGTAREASHEFWQIYRLPVVTVPTHRPCIREQWPDRIFADENSKWNAIVEEIVRVHPTGRPLLIGTRSVAASERLGQMLQEKNFHFNLLNAVRNQEEAAIVAEAGLPGRITIATNMAGRGTDIKLGSGVAAAGGLHVIATERHESSRVDRQLFGRSARQGDPGSAQAFVSVEDELVARHLSKAAHASLRHCVAGRWTGWEALARIAFGRAQAAAQRLAFGQRRGVLKADSWLEEALSFAGPDVA